MPEPVIRSERLDPEARALLERFDTLAAPRIETLDPVEARIGRIGPMKLLGGQPHPLERVEDLSIPAQGGGVPARLYASGRGGLRPALIYFHGGGFVLFNLDTHDAVCRALARESDAVVISVDYRLPLSTNSRPESKMRTPPPSGWPPTRSGWALTNAESLSVAIAPVATSQPWSQCAAGMRVVPLAAQAADLSRHRSKFI